MEKIKIISDEEIGELSLLEQVLEKGAELERLPFQAEVGLSFVDNEEIRTLNREQRGMDRATDVLSFPMLELTPGEATAPGPEETDPETGRVYLGDIVISTERAQEQAEEYGHSLQRELAFLTIHSLLHLLGYDHMEEEERKQMRSREEAVLSALGLTREEEMNESF